MPAFNVLLLSTTIVLTDAFVVTPQLYRPAPSTIDRLTMTHVFLLMGAIFGMLAVAFGAFGAHALKSRLTVELLNSYQTAVQYQFWHALALLAVGLLVLQLNPSRLLQSSGWLFFLGTLMFSGSIYLLTLTNIRHIGALNIGILTPIGGLSLMLGWLLLILALWRNQ